MEPSEESEESGDSLLDWALNTSGTSFTEETVSEKNLEISPYHNYRTSLARSASSQSAGVGLSNSQSGGLAVPRAPILENGDMVPSEEKVPAAVRIVSEDSSESSGSSYLRYRDSLARSASTRSSLELSNQAQLGSLALSAAPVIEEEDERPLQRQVPSSVPVMTESSDSDEVVAQAHAALADLSSSDEEQMASNGFRERDNRVGFAAAAVPAAQSAAIISQDSSRETADSSDSSGASYAVAQAEAVLADLSTSSGELDETPLSSPQNSDDQDKSPVPAMDLTSVSNEESDESFQNAAVNMMDTSDSSGASDVLAQAQAALSA